MGLDRSQDMGNQGARLMRGFLSGFLLGTLATSALSLTTTWTKEQVTPICFVRPSNSCFVSCAGGNSCTWTYSCVTAVCLVEPLEEGNQFKPVGGFAAQGLWQRAEVRPMTQVYPNRTGGFNQ